MQGWHAPSLDSAPGGSELVNGDLVDRGRSVFAANCASCHSGDLHSDFGLRAVSDVGVNSCASRTTNWSTGQIWQNFSSDTFKARPSGLVRTMSLEGVWANAPLLHNNSVGVASTGVDAASRVHAFEQSMQALLNPSSRPGKVSRTTDFILLGGSLVPAGFPIWQFANADGVGGNRCIDPVEDEGHTYGSTLGGGDKAALIEYLKTL
jgi:hypothetical protein